MTVHYSVESLRNLFLSDKYIEDKNKYRCSQKLSLQSLNTFLNSIEINKQYFRTGIQVKNPKYRRKVYDDTGLIKQLKLSLNKMSSLTYEKLCQDICNQLDSKNIFIQSYYNIYLSNLYYIIIIVFIMLDWLNFYISSLRILNY